MFQAPKISTRLFWPDTESAMFQMTNYRVIIKKQIIVRKQSKIVHGAIRNATRAKASFSACHIINRRQLRPGASGPAPDFYVKPTFDGRPASAGNGTMVAFMVRSQKQVRDLHAAALIAGGSDEGQPGFRAAYGPHFYVAYLKTLRATRLPCSPAIRTNLDEKGDILVQTPITASSRPMFRRQGRLDPAGDASADGTDSRLERGTPRSTIWCSKLN